MGYLDDLDDLPSSLLRAELDRRDIALRAGTCPYCRNLLKSHTCKYSGNYSAQQPLSHYHTLSQDARDFWRAQQAWSYATFGDPSVRGPLGPMRHLKKEVDNEILPELEAVMAGISPALEELSMRARMLEELVDVHFLNIDAIHRAKFTYEEFLAMCWTKLEKNRNRTWPPIADQNLTGATEHVRTAEERQEKAPLPAPRNILGPKFYQE